MWVWLDHHNFTPVDGWAGRWVCSSPPKLASKPKREMGVILPDPFPPSSPLPSYFITRKDVELHSFSSISSFIDLLGITKPSHTHYTNGLYSSRPNYRLTYPDHRETTSSRLHSCNYIDSFSKCVIPLQLVWCWPPGALARPWRVLHTHTFTRRRTQRRSE